MLTPDPRSSLAPSDAHAQVWMLLRPSRRRQAIAGAQACWPEGTAGERDLLALHLAAILALDDALETSLPLPTAAQEYRTLLPWHRGPPDDLPQVRAYESSRAPIRAALACVEAGLADEAPGSLNSARFAAIPGAVDSRSAVWWWRHQAELMLTATWHESRWRSSGPGPDEAAYLAVGEVSSAVGWIAASLRLLDGAALAPSADGPFLAATRAVAAALRLANDLHDTRRERREGKLQLLFLRSRALESRGFSHTGAWRRARREVQRLLLARVSDAQALLAPQYWEGSERVRAGLEGLLDAALGLIHVPGLGLADECREPDRQGRGPEAQRRQAMTGVWSPD